MSFTSDFYKAMNKGKKKEEQRQPEAAAPAVWRHPLLNENNAFDFSDLYPKLEREDPSTPLRSAQDDNAGTIYQRALEAQIRAQSPVMMGRTQAQREAEIRSQSPTMRGQNVYLQTALESMRRQQQSPVMRGTTQQEREAKLRQQSPVMRGKTQQERETEIREQSPVMKTGYNYQKELDDARREQERAEDEAAVQAGKEAARLRAQYENMKLGGYEDSALLARVEELEQQAQESRQRVFDSRRNRYAEIMNRADFRKNSGAFTPAERDGTNEIINSAYRENLLGLTNGEEPLLYLDDDERAIYNYLYRTQGKEAADEFLDFMGEELSRRAGAAMHGEMNLAQKIAAPAQAQVERFGQGFQTLLTGDSVTTTPMQYAAQNVRDEALWAGKQDEIAEYERKLAQYERGILKEKPEEPKPSALGRVLAAAVDLEATTVYMLPSILVSYLTSGLLSGAVEAGTISAAEAGSIAGIAGSATLGLSAGGNAMNEALKQGWTREQAGTYGLLVGASEAGLQYLLGGISKLGGVEALGDKAMEGVLQQIASLENANARFALNFGTQLFASGLSEGIEEGLQEIMEPYFKQMLRGEQAEVDLGEVAYSFLMGALSAGMLEAGDAWSEAGAMTYLGPEGVNYFEGVTNADELQQRYKELQEQGENRSVEIQHETLEAFFKGREMAQEASDTSSAADAAPSPQGEGIQAESVEEAIQQNSAEPETLQEAIQQQMQPESSNGQVNQEQIESTEPQTLEEAIQQQLEQNQNGGMTNGSENAEPADTGREQAAARPEERSALPDDGIGRRADERPGKRAERVPEGVRQRGQTREHKQLIQQRRERASLDPVSSPRGIGVPNGTDNQVCKALRNEADWDPEIREGVKWAREKGTDVVPVLGVIEVEADGQTGTADGVIDKRTGTLYVRADSKNFSFSENLEHELGHWLTTQQNVRTFMESVKSRYREAAWRQIYDAYRNRYAKITDDFAGMTQDEVDMYVWEEILEDAYAEANRYGTRASVYGAEADAALGRPEGAPAEQIREAQTTAPTSAEQTEQETRGPPATEQVGVSIDDKTESVNPTRLSLTSWKRSDYNAEKKKAAQEIAKSLGVSVRTATKYINDVNSIAKIIAEDRARLDYEASPGRSAFMSNAEYGGSLDFSTLCKKRRLLTGTLDAIQRALPNSALTADEVIKIREMMKKRGYEVSCGLCYVEGSRQHLGEYTKQFLDTLEGTGLYVPTMAEMNTFDGIEKIRLEHREVYEQYVKFMNKLAQRKPKLFQAATEYDGEILKKFRNDTTVKEKNRNGGLRLQSFSDFEIIHLIDNMQAIMDMARVGLAGQAYTKVPDFAWALGGTGLKINLSLIAKDVDADGNIILDEIEGMKRADAEALRNQYSKNVGTILVVFNDEQLKAAMKDDFIDFIIPFHRSQWSKAQYDAIGLPTGTKDYTDQQNESYLEPVYNKNGKPMRPDNYMPNTYWDFNKTGKENAEEYLRLCALNNRRPKFYKLLVNNGDGSYSLQPDGSTDGYWKLLIDFKMYDNNGKGSPQMPVRPRFNMTQAKRMLNEYNGGHQKLPAAQDVVDDFVRQYKKDRPGQTRFSMSDDVEEVGTLVAVHNLTEQNLRDALKLGGLPSPSIAIVKAEQGHSKYGPISAVFGRETIDPQTDSRNKVYGSDAWTPRVVTALMDSPVDIQMTAENIVKAMNQLPDRGAGYLGYGPSSIQALTSTNFQNINQMHEEENRIMQMADNNYQDLLDKFFDELDGTYDEILGTRHPAGNTTKIAQLLVETARGERTEQAIQEKFAQNGYDISNETARKIVEMYKHAAELPTEYFEAKPKRVVGFDEAKALLVPDNTSQNLISQAQAAGMNVVTYKAGNEQDRLAKLNSMPEVRFAASDDNIVPEGYNSMDEYANRLRTEREQMRQETMRDKNRTEFRGTDALDKIGVRIAGSVGVYQYTDSIIQNARAERSIRRATRQAEIRLNATEAEKTFAHGVAAGIYNLDEVPASMDADKVEELADYYEAESLTKNSRLSEQRKIIRQNVDEKAESIFAEREGDHFKPLGMIRLNHGTPLRNMERMFGTTRGREIYDSVFRPVADNEAERIRFVNRMFDEVRTFEDSKGKARELTKGESALVQQVIEGKAAGELAASLETSGAIRSAAENIQNGMDAGDAAQEFGLSPNERDLAQKLARWLQTQEQLKKADTKIIDAAVAKYQELYGEFYDAINDFLAAHGYEPIGFIRGYAPHMQPEETTDLLGKALKGCGINTEVTQLPTSIAGRTAQFKPNKRWDPFFLSRTGNETEYDIVKGFERYVDYMSDVLYHTDDVMRLRAAERYFRKTFAPENTRNLIEQAEELRYASPEQKESFLRAQNQIDAKSVLSPEAVAEKMDEFLDKQYTDVQHMTRFSDLAMWLDNFANLMAGKQSMADRGREYELGRKSLNVPSKIMRMFGQANVAGNISSALNQLAQWPMIQAEAGDRWTLQALVDVATGQITRGGWRDQSDFLTEKRGVENLRTEPAEKIITAMFKPAELMDTLLSTVAVRAKYLSEIHAGKSDADAMRAADDFGRMIMASRAKGSKPLTFHSKTLLNQMKNVFQIEALNSWEHITHDLTQEVKVIAKEQGKAKAAGWVANIAIKALLGAFLLNRLSDELYGGTPAPFDALGMLATFLASGNGLATNEYLETIIDNGLEKLTGERLFGSDARNLEGDFDTAQALKETGENVVNDIPFARNLAGMFGWGDQTVPVPQIGTRIGDLLDALFGEKKKTPGEAALNLATELIPGGRQIRKTAQGLKMQSQGGEFTNSGALKYPARDDAYGILQAALFGKYASREAQNYFAGGSKYQSPRSTTLWRQLVEGGMSPTEAYDYIRSMNRQEPEEGKTRVSDMQRLREIAAADIPEENKLEMIGTIVGTEMETETGNISQRGKMQALLDSGFTLDEVLDVKEQGYMDDYQKLTAARPQGITVDMYAEAKATIAEANEGGKITQEEARIGIDGLDITTEQKAVLWQMVNSGWNPEKNPFDVEAGRRYVEAMTGEPTMQGLSLPRLEDEATMSSGDELRGLSLPTL